VVAIAKIALSMKGRNCIKSYKLAMHSILKQSNKKNKKWIKNFLLLNSFFNNYVEIDK